VTHADAVGTGVGDTASPDADPVGSTPSAGTLPPQVNLGCHYVPLGAKCSDHENLRRRKSMASPSSPSGPRTLVMALSLATPGRLGALCPDRSRPRPQGWPPAMERKIEHRGAAGDRRGIAPALDRDPPVHLIGTRSRPGLSIWRHGINTSIPFKDAKAGPRPKGYRFALVSLNRDRAGGAAC
jgi:hypothetical protein